VTLGHFSYSLYLTHLPVLALCYLVIKRLGWPAPHAALALLSVGGVASLVCAYGFHLLVELPFMRKR
jgi:peptidoglycan/LPS O-acetylase OafA/YrhL